MATSAAMPQGLLHTLAQKPPSTCRAETIDFEQVGLPRYKGKYALLIHDLLSTEECNALLEAAEEAAGSKWDGAMVNVGGGRQRFIADVRLCDRILWDCPALASALTDRVKPFLPDNMVTLQNNAGVTGYGPVKRKETWELSRLNERLRFLKYSSGMYFRPHCDGTYATPDGAEMSFLTVQLYLNGSAPTSESPSKFESLLVGGATRFSDLGLREERKWDVNPATGACLVFQHSDLVHSGEEVLEGIKYTLRTDIMYKKTAAKDD